MDLLWTLQWIAEEEKENKPIKTLVTSHNICLKHAINIRNR